MDFAAVVVGGGVVGAAVAAELSRIPGNAEAISDPVVQDDPFIAGVAAASANGTGQPVNLEMNCAWDAMTNGLVTLYASADANPAHRQHSHSGTSTPPAKW